MPGFSFARSLLLCCRKEIQTCQIMSRHLASLINPRVPIRKGRETHIPLTNRSIGRVRNLMFCRASRIIRCQSFKMRPLMHPSVTTLVADL
jgi:hypothetical protein